jgi:phage-related protein
VREIVFYETPSGDKPVEKFLDSLSAKQAQKVVWVLRLIEELDRVPKQYFKKLEGSGEIWEVRVDFGGNTFRLLGFFDKDKLVVLTNGFAKKSHKTPIEEIRLAEKRKADHLKRKK